MGVTPPCVWRYIPDPSSLRLPYNFMRQWGSGPWHSGRGEGRKCSYLEIPHSVSVVACTSWCASLSVWFRAPGNLEPKDMNKQFPIGYYDSNTHKCVQSLLTVTSRTFSLTSLDFSPCFSCKTLSAFRHLSVSLLSHVIRSAELRVM